MLVEIFLILAITVLGIMLFPFILMAVLFIVGLVVIAIEAGINGGKNLANKVRRK